MGYSSGLPCKDANSMVVALVVAAVEGWNGSRDGRVVEYTRDVVHLLLLGLLLVCKLGTGQPGLHAQRNASHGTHEALHKGAV